MTRNAGVLAVFVVALLGIGPLQGRGLIPADGIFAFPPWSTTVAATPSNALLSDQYSTFAPLHQFVYDEVTHGRFPLWNPHAGAGMPTVASAQGALLYPINLALIFVPPFYAAAIAAAIKLWLGGIFMMLYMRRLGTGEAASLASGVVFALCAYMIVWLGSPQVNVAILLPLILYFIERDAGHSSGRAWVGLSLTFAAVFLGGHPPSAVHVLMWTTIYVLIRAWIVARPRWLTVVARAGAALLVGALVAAPQLFTYAEYYSVSSSADSSAAVQRWKSHLTLNTLVGFLLPKLAGNPADRNSLSPEHIGLGKMDNFNERSIYVGLLPLFLAVVAVVKRRDWTSWFFGGTIVFWLTVAYGAPPWPWLFGHLPVFSVINPQRAVLFVLFAIAVLSGLGLDWLRAHRAGATRLAITFAAIVTAVAVTMWLIVSAHVNDAGPRSAIAWQFVVPFMAVGVVLAIFSTQRWSSWMPIVCVAAIAGDLIWFGAGYNPSVARSDYYPSTPAIDFLKRDPSTFRVLGLGAMPANTAEVYGLDDARGIDFMSVKRYEELITGRSGDFFFFLDTDRAPDTMNLLNVKYVLLPEQQPTPDNYKLVFSGDLAVYQYLESRPRALVVFDHRVKADSARLLQDVRQPTFRPEDTVLLEEEVEPLSTPAEPSISSATATIVSHTPNEVVVDVTAPRAGFLLLLDTYYPGWKAYVNGRETRILRGDYAFRTVQVPSGKTTVTFSYRPTSFRAGLIAAGLALAALAIVWFRASP